MPMCSGLLSSVFSLITQHQFLRSTTQHLVVLTFSLRLVALIGAKYQYVMTKRLSLSPSSQSGSLMSGMCPYLLTCTRPGRVTQGSKFHGIFSKSRLLPKSNRPANSYTGLELSMFVLWTTALLGAPLSPVNKVPYKYQLPCLILSVSRTPSQLALWTS